MPATLHSAMSKLLDSVPGLASKVMSPATRDARARDTYENLGAEVVIAGWPRALAVCRSRWLSGRGRTVWRPLHVSDAPLDLERLEQVVDVVRVRRDDLAPRAILGHRGYQGVENVGR